MKGNGWVICKPLCSVGLRESEGSREHSRSGMKNGGK